MNENERFRKQGRGWSGGGGESGTEIRWEGLDHSQASPAG